MTACGVRDLGGGRAGRRASPDAALLRAQGARGPARTGGGNRRFSQLTSARLRRIQKLTAGGLNLEGVRRVLELEAEVARLRPSSNGPGRGAGPRRADPSPLPP